MENEKLTYREVGISEGLQYNTLERYVQYMTIRWKDNERTNCLCGYAQEWADRFKKGCEYLASDGGGLKVLREIDTQQIAKLDAALEEIKETYKRIKDADDTQIIYLKKIDENEVKPVQPEEFFRHMEDVFGEM